MKKFTFKGVLDGFRSSVAQQVKPDQEIIENLRSEHFQVKKTFRHGFPYQPTAVAFDPVQRLLAIGTKSGSLRILGRPGVDTHVKHEGGAAVIQLLFLVNEGALVSATADDTLHLWNFRQKIPQVVQSLKFQRERITCMHLPLQSKWLYVGTERGNIHILHIETFVLSGYVINWNKAIEVSRKTHPGAVIHLSDNPLDLSKMLIGYESGQIVLWDLKLKAADYRCQADEPLRSISWHHEGKQFMCSHTDGSLSTWALRQLKPINVIHPHAKNTKDGEPEACKSIQKVEWKLSRSGEAYVIFSGGLAYDTTGRTPSITVIQGKTTTVLEMEHSVVDFITLCESPWTSDFQDPYAVVVLLQNDLVVIDLLTAGFPCFENPYPMDIHESPVTCCAYFADCPSDLVPAFYSVGSKSQKKTGFSEKEWPISGGEWSPNSSSYNEIILTGHADGSIKFWDASAGTLQVLYKLKTAKLFEKSRTRSLDSEEDPLAVQLIFLCPESRKLAIAGSGRHVILFKFKKVESMSEIVTLEIPLTSDPSKETECSPDYEYPPSGNVAGEELKNHSVEYTYPLKVKGGLQKRAAGFQATLICLTPWINGEQPENITALSLNSSYGLLAYGSETGLAIVDIVQKVSLLVMSTADLCSNTDTYQRALRSPKRQDESKKENDDKARSPSIDQMNGMCISPTTGRGGSSGGGGGGGVGGNAVGVISERVDTGDNDGVGSGIIGGGGGNTGGLLGSIGTSGTSGYRGTANGGTTTSTNNSATINSSNTGGGGDSAGNNNNNNNDGSVGNTRFRKATSATRLDVLEPVRHSRSQGIRKLQKCLSTTISHYDADGSTSGSFSSSFPFHAQRSVEIRNYQPSATTSQASMTSQYILANARQYSSFDKLDNSFQRSRSSSMSSLENIATETISCLTFADSYTKKSDASALPTLWIGTSLGSIQTIVFNAPAHGERDSQPVIVSTYSGSMFKLKGSILTMSFLDCNGALIPYSYESWKDENLDYRDRNKAQGKFANSKSSSLNAQVVGDGFEDRQFVVLTSEKQARVVALPSQNCVYRQQLADADIVIKAEITSLKDSVCLVCYVSSGHIATYSLPSLRPLIDVDFLPLLDLSFQTTKHGIVDPMLSIWGHQLFVNGDTDQIARTLCFSNKGHGLYLSSPTEIQKFSVSSEFCSELTEMMGDMFIGHDMPEPPKESFFKGLFGGGSRSLDREELFGESSGRASRTVAKHIPGPLTNTEGLRERVSTATGDVAMAHQMVMERGEKLSQLEDRTARMMSEADNFSQSAHGLMVKYKDKKWYQL
ncbi:syntaxin-binding protein 5 isoform X7 [Cephus cinctus]|uniref:Syntaxin-binding protein 5-like n=1 Tax=Cephus cinctus TaxID=211228 RepID=A0AAJ7FCJ6_CEPCN|nr:syntaxin-binding protein 5 isoform X7 [Cephus cinctus]